MLTLPRVFALDERTRTGDPVKQLAERTSRLNGAFLPYQHGQVHGLLLRPDNGNDDILFLPKNIKRLPDAYTRILMAPLDLVARTVDLNKALWLRHPLLATPGRQIDYELEIQRVSDSWQGSFFYVQEDQERDLVGLRSPQLGALHAIHAHWAVSDAPATVVMPTGTGKTETMLSVLLSVVCPKLLVIVPTDALRTQIVEKFVTLGILKSDQSTILDQRARYPIVCTLLHIPRSMEEVDDIFNRAQVIVTTSHIVGRCDGETQSRMAHHCPYLFIDEAHHAEAPTWSGFKQQFRSRRVVQFTATPFREDGKPLDGEIVFKYPLKKAQEEGYFKSIRFEPVVAFNRKRADRKIARKAVEILRAEAHLGHILMARVESIARSKEVFPLYKEFEEFNPVELNTEIKSSREREKIRDEIISGKSRIVVCVDMLGEGFDLPELKIAAFHDIRKTLAVTLQLAGRFTRARPDLGNATFIANTAAVDVREELQKLYTRDPDWNLLLPQLSETAITEQVSLQSFLKGFTHFVDDIPLKTVTPATSAVVYKTFCDEWSPSNFRAGIPGIESCEQVHHAINSSEHTLVIVTARRVSLPWTNVETLFSWDWELYVVFWLSDRNLLFINSSTNAGEYKPLAKAVAGERATLISGNNVFRSFAGVRRLHLQNVGLTELLGRNVRYTGRMGADVGSEVTGAQRQRTVKSVLAGTGYEDGEDATIGASKKGRIWSRRRERLDHLITWCKNVGNKLLDENIDPEEILKGTLVSKTIATRPEKMPFFSDWPEEIYKSTEAQWEILIDRVKYSIGDVELLLRSPTVGGPILIQVAAETIRVGIELELFEALDIPSYVFRQIDGPSIEIRRGERAESEPIIDFFYENPPPIWFVDGSYLEGNQYVELPNLRSSFEQEHIRVWDWNGTDIKKEAQGEGRDVDSIQARVIREVVKQGHHLVMDDNDTGESADVVAIRVVGTLEAPTKIEVEFYHCKYSQKPSPGRRVEDLYEVCGQAQKSLGWLYSNERRTDLFDHLMRREESRREAGRASRYATGSDEMLQTIREISRLCPVVFKIFIVQPGLSKAQVSPDQLALLGVTENYLMEVRKVPFGVIGSA
jgi:superfamily II DNA or RNA helicase